MRQWDKFLENIASWLLILSGLVGLAISVANFIGWEPPFLSTNAILLTLLTVALLSTAIGLERIGRFRRHDQQIERLEAMMVRSLGGQHLVRYDEVYIAMMRQVSTMKRRLRTIAVGRSITTPRKWAETVARKLQETKRAGAPAKFEAILAVDFDNLPPNFQKGIEDRLNIYRRYGVSELVSVYLLNLKPPILFDTHIVDKEHFSLAFRTLTESGNTHFGIAFEGITFENQPLIASEFADWYDQIVLKKAIPYEDWLQTYQQKKMP